MNLPGLQNPSMCQLPRTLLLAITAQWLFISSSALAADVAAPSSAQTTAEVTDGRALLPERQALNAAALQRSLPEAEQQTLQTPEESFLALWRLANSATARGVVILLHGDGESADWPMTIGPLRARLPDAQWHTLSLSLPDPPSTHSVAAPPTEAVDAPDNAEAPQASAENTAVSPTELQQVYAARISARLSSAIAFATASKPDEIVLLGHGSGAFWAAGFLSQNDKAGVTRLALINPKIPEGATPPFEESLPALRLAIGDFYFMAPTEQALAEQRQQASIRSQHPAYQQTALNALPGNPEVEQEQLYRRLRGWLDKPATPPDAADKVKPPSTLPQRKP